MWRPTAGLVGRLLTEGAFAAHLIFARLSGVKARMRLISVCPSIFAVAVAPLFKARGGRHLVIVHDIQSGLGGSVAGGGPAMRLLRLLERIALNRADVIVTLSRGMETALREIGVTVPIVIAPPQVDVRELTVLPEPPGTPLALYSGAFGKKQGLEQVLAAARILQDRGSTVRILLRGQGGIEHQLRTKCREEGLRNTEIEPLAPRDQLNLAMSQGTIHLVPQAAGGANYAVPSKAFSIMSAGRPFVATAEPGSPLDMLVKESGAGICVPPDHPEELAGAIDRIAADPELRASLGQAGRRYVETKVDREVVCRKILAALDGTAVY